LAAGKLQGIEIEDAGKYLVAGNRSSVHQHAQSIERCCDEQAIAATRQLCGKTLGLSV
jgi:hypothetical protein